MHALTLLLLPHRLIIFLDLECVTRLNGRLYWNRWRVTLLEPSPLSHIVLTCVTNLPSKEHQFNFPLPWYINITL
jgi:hypothetical protein